MLPGPILDKLQTALSDAFEDAELQKLVRTRLNEKPGNILIGSSFDERVTSLVVWADRKGRIDDVFNAALEMNDGNEMLQQTRRYLAAFVPPVYHIDGQLAVDVKEALKNSRVSDHAVLDALEAKLDDVITAGIAKSANPNTRTGFTFDVLNRARPTAGGDVPLATWLRGAIAVGVTNVVLERALVRIQQSTAGVEPIPPEKLVSVVRRRGGDEKIIHHDDMLPIAFLAAGAEAARSVCRLEVPEFRLGLQVRDTERVPYKTSGSAWLVTENLLITNHHVVNNRGQSENGTPTIAPEADFLLQARNSIAQFDFDGVGATSDDIAVSDVLVSSPRSGPLDYAILRLACPVAGRRPLRIVQEPVFVDEAQSMRPAVNIIQHPQRSSERGTTTYKMVACRNNLALRTEGVDLWYFTDTLDGSSGSPVFNDNWRVIALHKRWQPVDEVSFQGKSTAVANVGTQMSAILEDVGRQNRALFDEIIACQARLTERST